MPLKAKQLTVSVLDSRVSPLLPSWERDRNWRGTQSNLQVSTASDPDAEWSLDRLSWLVESCDPPRVTQELSAWQPKSRSTHVTSTTIYISTPNHYFYLLRCIGSKSQDRNEMAIIKLHLLAFGIHCLLLLWVSRLIFFFCLQRL